MSNLHTYHLKLDFQNVDQHTRGKWLIHGTKHRKENQWQSRELPSRISYLQNQNLVTKSLKCTKKVMNGHKNPNIGHNYHDENHDKIEFYQGNSNRSN